ncbi:MAG TPA: Uma2 family endonuclease [Longimicrobium sp.]|jgi:Uma2 family endonuclease|nr:Uma2 family endonuclease [Longimicrobium sp.]
MSTAIEMEDEIEDAVDLEPQRRRFTVEEFQRMGEAGIFAPDERVELIGGEIIRMTPIGPWHMQSVFALEDYLRPIVGQDVRISIQMPIQLPESAPQPDIALLRRNEMPSDRLPPPSACLLVVEVSDSTVLFDRNQKRLDYAAGGIVEYWVLDLPAQAVVVHLEPISGDYRKIAEYRRGTVFDSPALGRKVHVNDLLVPKA